MKRLLALLILVTLQFGFGSSKAEEPAGNMATVQVWVMDWDDNPVADAVVEVKKGGEIKYSGISASSGPIEFSLPYTFHPPFVEVDEEEVRIVPEFSLGIPYPNPAGGKLSVDLSLPLEVDNLKVELYNVLGQRVYRKTLDGLSSGSYRLELALEGLGIGIYFLKLEDDVGDIAVRKFVNLGKSCTGGPSLSISQIGGGYDPLELVGRPKVATPGDEVYEFLAYVGKEGAVAELPDGSTYKLKSGFAREFIRVRGDTTLILRLENNPIAVTGVVYEVGSAMPISGIRVWLYDVSSEDTVEATTGLDGRYKLYPVHPIKGALLFAEDPGDRYRKKAIDTGYLLLSKDDVDIDIYMELMGQGKPPEGGERPPEEITVEFVASSYKVAEPSGTGGSFRTGRHRAGLVRLRLFRGTSYVQPSRRDSHRREEVDLGRYPK